jgi:UrcA family protein
MKYGQGFALAASLALASTVAPAFAEPTAPKSVAVQYDRVDLHRPEAVRALYARIRAASRSVCAGAEGRGAGQQAAWNACRRAALDRAVAAIGSEAVARLHASRSARAGSARPS